MNQLKFKPRRDGRTFSAYVSLSDDQRAAWSDRKITHVRIDVEYTKGGINYFSGSTNRRGYRVLTRPVSISTIEGDVCSESFSIMGSQKNCGGFVMLEEVPRFNKRRLCQWAAVIEPIVPALSNAVVADNRHALLEQVTAIRDRVLNKAAL